VGRAKATAGHLGDSFAGVFGSTRGLVGAHARQRDDAIAVENEAMETAAVLKAQRQSLKGAAATLSHIGDYGWLFWHPQRGQIIWTAADSDGDGTSTYGEIERAFAALDFVNSVEVIAEGYPEDLGDLAEFTEDGELYNGWRRIAHEATVNADAEGDGDDTNDSEDVKWQESASANRIGDAWVRPGHEDSYRAWIASQEF